MIKLNKKFLIYGYGVSGKSVEKYLINNNCNFNIYDDFKKILNKRVISKKYLENKINQYSYFVVSPSIKIEKNHFLYKHKNKILIDLDFLSLEISSQKILGVTGTEGKSSTCSYINQILSKKYKTKIIGNFGNTILDKTNLKKYLSKIDILIIELSSYQLDKLKFLKLHYALITNIFSDHLDYHRNIKNYISSKFRIQDFLYKNSPLFLSNYLFLKHRSHVKINKNRLILNDEKIIHKKDLPNHIRELNLYSIKNLIYFIDSRIKIKNINVSDDLSHRIQLIYNKNSLKIYNDSKCTNLNNAVYKNNLINSSKKILILGGILKKQDKNLKFNIKNTLVLTFGNQRDLFINQLNLIDSNYFKFNRLIELINFLKLIVKLRKYEYILFSPGGESFDSFKNYIDRGNYFNRLIKKAIS